MTVPQRHQRGMPAPQESRSRGIRFSLFSMILLITVVALSISHWQMSEQLSQMKYRSEQLGKSLGIPPISDPSKVTAIGVPLMVDHAWEWHLVIPQGKEFDLYIAFTQIPDDGLPRNRILVDSLTDGEVRINLSIDTSVEFAPTISVQSKYVRPSKEAEMMLYHGLSRNEASWIEHFGGEFRDVSSAKSFSGKAFLRWYRTRNEGLIRDPEFVVTSFDPDKAIVLRRTRVFPIDEEDDKTEPKTCAGMMVWLVPKHIESDTEED